MSADGRRMPRSIWERYGFETPGDVGELADRHAGELTLRADERAEVDESVVAFVGAVDRRPDPRRSPASPTVQNSPSNPSTDASPSR